MWKKIETAQLLLPVTPQDPTKTIDIRAEDVFTEVFLRHVKNLVPQCVRDEATVNNVDLIFQQLKFHDDVMYSEQCCQEFEELWNDQDNMESIVCFVISLFEFAHLQIPKQ